MIQQGTILDNTYRIVETIGAGGGGEIYLADHLRLEKPVIIKKIKDRVRGVIESRGEADILKKLNHPYLPQVYDYFIENNQVYTVMEYIEGENFQQLLKKGTKFTTKDIIKWGTQLSEVVAYLHSQTPPIIHRDIKPSNIMLTPKGNVCLIDFNVSLEQDKTKGIIAHTDGYSPREQYGIKKEENDKKKIKENKKKKSKQTFDDLTDIVPDDLMPQNSLDDRTEIATEIAADIATEIVDDNFEDHTDMDATDVVDSVFESSINHNRSGKSILLTDSVAPNKSLSYASNVAQKYEVLPKADERSDIYSLGATLYHIITQRRPEKATEHVTPLSDCDAKVSDGLIHIIEKAMQQNPAKRYQTADKMKNAFVNIRKLDREYILYSVQRDVLTGVAIAIACVSAVCMVLGYRKMQAEEYNAYVAQIETANELYLQGEMSEASEACKRAIEMRPQDLDAYIELVNIYYMWNYYAEGISVIQQIDINENETDQKIRSQYAMLKFLEGECYMGLEEFNLATDSYKMALKYQPKEGSYYTRCAIALAREGDKQSAEKFLEDALQKGISDAAVYLTKAEILLSEKKYVEAEELIYKVLEMSEDDDLSYHAYLTGVQIYNDGANVIDNAVEMKKSLLETAIERLDSSYGLSLSEQLAEVYYELADTVENENQAKRYYEKALVYFNDILKNGYRNVHILQNIAFINQTLGNYEEAEKTFIYMIEMYPEDYTGFMNLTLLYSEIQDKISVENRNYEAVFENYEKADVLYQRYLNTGGKVDTKMQILENMMEDLKLLAN